ncbi:MAG: (2Fe-2S)-binding domain protein [Burkholderia sp.]|jgi:carbon-monoxide dehydrogenase small subunit|nr:(2Fe-2S)-binding domain protein [Burkholderia sp.]
MKMNENITAEFTAGPQPIRLHLNGEWIQRDATPRTHLGDFVREHCGLTGTHLGCEHGVCGACTVLVDDKPVRSCITFAVACDSKDVRTIEGYGDDPWMAKLREAFSREHALQCGYCTPGMLATAYDIVRRLPDADEQRIRVELSGNLCRCTGYVGIVRAIQSVLADLKANPVSDTPVQSTQAMAIPVSAGKMQAFEASAVASTAGPVAREEQAAPGENRKGWSRIEDSFTVDFSPEQVWAFMSDVRALASCLPGAEVLESEGKTVKGRIAIKFGPITAAFNGSAMLERDDAKRVGTLRGAGTDTISNSRAKGDVGYRVLGIDGGRTKVEITLDHMLQGALAQFSRSGLVKDFVSRMIADFGRNLSARMGGATVEQLSASQPSMAKTMLSIVWARIKRVFGG